MHEQDAGEERETLYRSISLIIKQHISEKKNVFLCVCLFFSLLQSVSVDDASAQQWKQCLRGEQVRSNETRVFFSEYGWQRVDEAGVSLSPEIIVLRVHQECHI